MSNPASLSRSGRNPNTALLIGAAGSFLGNINGSIINVLLPTLSQSFQRGISDAAILSLAFLLSQTLTLFIAGRLCDVRSTRSIFLWGFGLHSFSTILCVFAPTLELLAVCRLAQGTATALITVAASVAVLRSIPRRKLGRAFGLITLSASLGYAAGPSIGGFLLEFLHWRAVFVVIFGIGFLTFGYTWFFYSDRIRKRRFKMDPVSITLAWLSMGALFAALIGLTRLGIWHSAVGIAFLSTWFCTFAFVRRSLYEDDPLLSLDVLRNLPLAAVLAGSLCNAVFFSGLIFALPFYLKFVRGLSDYQMGLLLMAPPLAGLLGAWLGGTLADRFGAQKNALPVAVANVPILMALTQIHETTSPTILAALLGWFGLCYIFYRTSCTTMVMSWAKKGEEGKLSAIRLLLPVLGTAAGISIFAVFFDNTTVPTVAQASEILGHFRQAVWFGLAIVILQILCTFWAASAPYEPVSRPAKWKEGDSFLDQ